MSNDVKSVTFLSICKEKHRDSFGYVLNKILKNSNSPTMPQKWEEILQSSPCKASAILILPNLEARAQQKGSYRLINLMTITKATAH